MRETEEQYRAWAHKVFHFLLSLCHDEYLAEELTQETLYRAALKYHTFRGECRPETWLCCIARNLYINECRRRQRLVQLDEQAPLTDQETETDSADADAAEHIRRCLEQLNEPYKEVFTLHVLGEVPLKEIASLFQKSESWARVTFMRAKAQIIRMMEET